MIGDVEELGHHRRLVLENDPARKDLDRSPLAVPVQQVDFEVVRRILARFPLLRFPHPFSLEISGDDHLDRLIQQLPAVPAGEQFHLVVAQQESLLTVDGDGQGAQLHQAAVFLFRIDELPGPFLHLALEPGSLSGESPLAHVEEQSHQGSKQQHQSHPEGPGHVERSGHHQRECAGADCMFAVA